MTTGGGTRTNVPPLATPLILHVPSSKSTDPENLSQILQLFDLLQINKWTNSSGNVPVVFFAEGNKCAHCLVWLLL